MCVNKPFAPSFPLCFSLQSAFLREAQREGVIPCCGSSDRWRVWENDPRVLCGVCVSPCCWGYSGKLQGAGSAEQG